MSGDETQPIEKSAGVQGAGPRIRIGAIVWGVVLLAIAAAGVWWTSDRDRFETALWAIARFRIEADPIDVTVAGAIAFGAVLVIGGAIGLARRAQERGAARAAAPASDGDVGDPA